MRAVTVAALVAAPLLAAGCVTTPAVEAGVKVRPETRPECAAHCETLGMRLAAIVLIRNAAGCVCELREAPAAERGAAAPGAALQGGGSAAAGGALVIALEEERQHREEAQRRDDEERRRRDDDDRRRRDDDARRRRTTP